MSVLASLLSIRADAQPIGPRELLMMITGGYESDAGVLVNPESSLRVADVYACVRVLSETVAQLPLILYRRTEDGRERAVEHPLYNLLHSRPNSFQTRFEFVEMLQAHVLLGGMAFAIPTKFAGAYKELIPVPSDRVTVDQKYSGEPIYTITFPDGTQKEFNKKQLLIIPGLAYDGICGRGVIDYQRNTVGLAHEQDRTEGRMVRQGLKLSGTIEHPGRLKDENVRKRLEASFQENYAGPNNAGKVILLEEGLKLNRSGLTAEEAQFLEYRKFTRSQIAGFFRVPPHMIGDLERSTFSNIEHQALEFVKYSIGPWIVRWEQRLSTTLLTPEEQKTLYFEFLVDGLLRGDIRSRYDAYQTGILTGFLNRNEVRERENLNRKEGLDEFWAPVNMTAQDLLRENAARNSGRESE